MKKQYLVAVLLLGGLIVTAHANYMGIGASTGGVVNLSGGVPIPADIGTSTQQSAVINQQLTVMKQMRSLEQTVNNLRGLIETQGHELQQLQLKIMSLEQSAKINAAFGTTNNASNDLKNNTSALSSNASKLYLMAYQSMQAKDYTQAINQFNEYAKKYSDGSQIDAVYYWLGELYSVSGDTKAATKAFNTLLTKYPKSKSAPGGMLQLGMIHYSNGQYAAADKLFSQLVMQYPNSDAAKAAQHQLEQLKKAGY